jgi:hypothetical protein
MLKNFPPKNIPTIALFFAYGDNAIAQTTQQTQPLPLPQTSTPYSIDPASAIAILISSSVAIFAIAPKLLEKWFGGAIEARQNKNDLHTLITKSQAELELDEKRKELESANELSNFYLESAREGRKSEKELLMLFVTKELDRSKQTNDQIYELIDNQKLMIARMESIENLCRSNNISLKDVFNVLRMKERSDNKDIVKD